MKAPRSNSRSRQRGGYQAEGGAAAVEFAMVLFGASTVMGTMVFARVKLTNMASLIVRTCSGTYPINVNDMTACANVMRDHISYQAHLPGACNPSLGILEVGPLASPPYPKHFHMLQITLSCNFEVGGGDTGGGGLLVAAQSHGASNLNLSAKTITATAAMPYMGVAKPVADPT
jgi:hypothetical protein